MRAQIKHYSRLLLFIGFLLSIMIICASKSSAANYPTVFFYGDSSYEKQTIETSKEVGERVTIYMDWYPVYKYEGYELNIYDSVGKVVFSSSNTFTNSSSTERHFSVFWHTDGSKKGDYRAVVTKKFYTNYQWCEAPTKSNFYISLTHFNCKWSDWKTVKYPTCTKNGTQEKVCSICGDKISIPIFATGHNWGNYEYTVDRRASSTHTGLETFHCIVCGYSDPEYAVTIPKWKLYVHAPTKKVSAKKLRKKSRTIKIFTVSNGYGKISYKIVGGKAKAKKALKLKNNGKITVKKKTKKGTYKLKIKVSAAGTAEYAPQSKTVVVKVIVK